MLWFELSTRRHPARGSGLPLSLAYCATSRSVRAHCPRICHVPIANPEPGSPRAALHHALSSPWGPRWRRTSGTTRAAGQPRPQDISGTVRWSYSHPNYRSDLGLGGTQIAAGTAANIWMSGCGVDRRPGDAGAPCHSGKQGRACTAGRADGEQDAAAQRRQALGNWRLAPWRSCDGWPRWDPARAATQRPAPSFPRATSRHPSAVSARTVAAMWRPWPPPASVQVRATQTARHSPKPRPHDGPAADL